MDPQNQTPSTPPSNPVPPTTPAQPTDQMSATPSTPTSAEEPTSNFGVSSSTATAPAETPAPAMPQYNAGTQNPAVVPTGEDPGKVLGILGIVLGLLVMAPLGIILGIMSKNRSKAAGYDGSLGQVSLIIGAVLTVLGVLVLVGFIALAVMAGDTSGTY